MGVLRFCDLGTVGYAECTEFQKRLVELRLEGRIEDTLLLLEHNPVITIGTSGGRENLLAEDGRLKAAGIELFNTNRGGNITYHGPGQIVGYPIFNLKDHGRDAHLFLRNLEQVVIDFLASQGITGERVPGLTGVWVGEDKICSMGIAVRRWVSWHGLALNIHPNFEHWALIHPCGLVGRHVTSVDRLTGRTMNMSDVKRLMAEKAGGVFGIEPVPISREELFEIAGEAL